MLQNSNSVKSGRVQQELELNSVVATQVGVDSFKIELTSVSSESSSLIFSKRFASLTASLKLVKLVASFNFLFRLTEYSLFPKRSGLLQSLSTTSKQRSTRGYIASTSCRRTRCRGDNRLLL